MAGAPVTVEEAQRLLAAEVPPPIEEEVVLLDAVGAALAQDAVSDRDMPPFDRATMDGYAVAAADTPGTLEPAGEIAAGHPSTAPVARGQCAKIMTGAPLPPGADAVQQVEKTAVADGRVRILEAVRPGQNVSRRGEQARQGEVILRCGHVVRPAEIAVLASFGCSRVPVFRRPRCAMFATGDEIVDLAATPGPAQIRNSNAYSVAALVRAMGITCDVLPTVRDRVEDLRAAIRTGLERDVLLMSGGVSAGDWDLVPHALGAEGVRCVVHQVRIRPGKPFYFGRRDGKVVFALPGNPVSAFVTFEVFVRPFLGRMMGREDMARPVVRRRLAAALPKKLDRAQYVPSAIEGERVRPVPWTGSGDIIALARANALAIQPAETVLNEGDVVDVMLL